MDVCSRLATNLDEWMLRSTTRIYDPTVGVQAMGEVSDLARQVGGRYLLRYLLPHQVTDLLDGTSERQFVTPTPFAPSETVPWLTLPAPVEPRRFVLLLEPTQLRRVFGPRWVRMGGGIEYILDEGFGPDAIVDLSPDQGLPARWALEIR